MHPEREHRNLGPATADLYLFGTIRIPEKVARTIAFIGAIFIAFLVVNSCVELYKKSTPPDPFVSGPGALSSSEKYISCWSDDEINAVIAEAKSGDYDHLVQTIMGYSE